MVREKVTDRKVGYSDLDGNYWGLWYIPRSEFPNGRYPERLDVTVEEK